MEKEQIRDIANTLHQARLNAVPLGQFSSELSDFKRSDAYSIQEAGIHLREEMGEKVIGLKMGLTSEGKRKQMNLDSPLYGVLTDKMQIQNGGVFKLQGTIHPKIEPEVAFFIGKELKGIITREEVLDATESVCAALEILDSRYKGFKYFSMEDVIADNSSSSHYILGPKLYDFKNINLKDLAMFMKVNDETVISGNSSAISDDPVNSIIDLSKLLSQRGLSIPAGSFVLAGAATAAIDLKAKMKVSLEVQHLPTLHVFIEE